MGVAEPPKSLVASVPPRRVRRRRETSLCVARAVEVSEMCPRVQQTNNTKSANLQVCCLSPLTDSNRRPPPYHLTVTATGGKPRQQIWLVSAVPAAARFAADCHWLHLLGSTNAPSLLAPPFSLLATRGSEVPPRSALSLADQQGVTAPNLAC